MLQFFSLASILLTMSPRSMPPAGSGALPTTSGPPTSQCRLHCLMYHRFVDDADFPGLPRREQDYAIGIARFESHLRFLREQGYRSVNLHEATAYVRGELNLEDNAVLITIDDGCRSALELAAPLLKRYGFTAILFVTTDPAAYVFHGGSDSALEPTGECPRYDARLSDAQLRQWLALGFDVGSHGVTHRPLTDLPDAALRRELSGSRDDLHAATGAEVMALSAPGGCYDARVARFAAQAGYTAVFTSHTGGLRPGDDILWLRRQNVSGRWDDRRLARALAR